MKELASHYINRYIFFAFNMYLLEKYIHAGVEMISCALDIASGKWPLVINAYEIFD